MIARGSRLGDHACEIIEYLKDPVQEFCEGLMRYRSFTVRNFKGIAEAKIELAQGEQSIPVTLIGLNESGKTTLLEAIYSFNPDMSSKILFSSDHSIVPDETARIPINRLSNFTGVISVEAAIDLSKDDKDAVAVALEEKGWKLERSTLPDQITVAREMEYQNSTLKRTEKIWDIPFQSSKGRGKFRDSTREQALVAIEALEDLLPSIDYFPTSVFNFPPRIYLNRTPTDGLNNFYRRIFQDILDAQGEGLNIKTHILDRIAPATAIAAFSEMIATFYGSSERGKVQHVIDKASHTVSTTIVARWNSLFKHSSINREIIVDYGIEPGEGANAEPRVFVEFKIKDGSERYNISSRSLGFRWFFCFLLFTQFRTKRRGSSGTLFLFDEPASNLHAAAQEELLVSFQSIASQPNELIYSTHSHHLVNPIWLEQAYIVVNESNDYEADVTGLQISQAGNVRPVPYRQFVNRHPDRTSYFQPVLDRLEVRPQSMELNQDCVLLEGKSDFAVLSYFSKRLGHAVPLLPAFGATTMGALVALLRGWGRKFVVLLDGDSEGRDAFATYKKDYSLQGQEIALLPDVLSGATEIEKLLSATDRVNLAALLGVTKLTKKNINNMFQEAAAAGAELPLEQQTLDKVEALLNELQSRLRAGAAAS